MHHPFIKREIKCYDYNCDAEALGANQRKATTPAMVIPKYFAPGVTQCFLFLHGLEKDCWCVDLLRNHSHFF